MPGRRYIPVTILLTLALLIVVPATLSFQPVQAVKGLLNRTLFLSTSETAASAEYQFEFDIGYNTQLGSIRFEFCSNDPIPFIACTPPSGFDISGAALTTQTGETGFSIDPGVTNNEILITRAPAIPVPQTVSYIFDPVINPDAEGSYFVRVYTYSTDDGTGPNIEESGIAFAINDTFDVTAYVPPYLQFCVGLTITADDCSTATGNLIDFGILSSTSANFATSQMTAATNAIDGLAITLIGTTMTSGVNSIASLSTRNISIPGTPQFGINLRDNAVPNVGVDPSGSGVITPLGDYNIINEFVFNSGDQIASSNTTTRFNTLTASYLVNVQPNQEPGIYTATLTYIATATF